jgi:ATP-dependent DNA ligase
LLLGYYTPEGKLIYAGRAGTGLLDAELERLSSKPRPKPPTHRAASLLSRAGAIERMLVV